MGLKHQLAAVKCAPTHAQPVRCSRRYMGRSNSLFQPEFTILRWLSSIRTSAPGCRIGYMDQSSEPMNA